MYKSLVLLFVAEPSKLMFTSIKGACFSIGSTITIWIMSWMFLAGSFTVATTMALTFFVIVHSFMILMTVKDQYFFNVVEAKIICKKTKNLIYTKDNLYGA
jgi:hypothetical protein